MNTNNQNTTGDCCESDRMLKLVERIMDKDLKLHPENIQQYLKIVCDRVEHASI